MEGKVPVGTKVRYHGSVDYLHGEYEVEGYCEVSERGDLTPEQVTEHWPDGVSYELWPVGMPRKFGLRENALYFVRRSSFTVLDS